MHWITLRRAGIGGFLLAAASLAHAAITVRDDAGRTFSFENPPQRIVSLLPSLTESLCALDACAQLVGVDRYANWPAAVNALPRLGDLESAPVERIVALKPDVVLAARSARLIERLDSLGVPVLLLKSDTTEDLRRSWQTLATLLGRPEAATRLWATVDAQIAQAAARVPAATHGQRVYFEVATTPYAAGEASFIGQLLTRLGAGNIVPADLGPFPHLNAEYVVRQQPDIIMAEARALQGMAARPGWDTLHALQSHHSCGFDAAHYDILVRPGPRMGEAATV